MKAKYNFEIMELEEGLVAVPIGSGSEQFHGVLKVNETAVDILKLLAQDTTEEKIVTALIDKYDGDTKQITDYVHSFIEELKQENIIEQ